MVGQSDGKTRRLIVLPPMDLDPWRATFGGEYGPQNWPYGIEQLATMRHWSLHDPRIRWPRTQGVLKVSDVVHHWTGLPYAAGLAAWLEDGLATLALLENEGMAAAQFPRTRPVISFSCWVAERIRTMKSSERRRLLRRMSRIDLILTWSSNQLPILEDFGLDPIRLASVPLGVDTTFYRPGQPNRSIDVLAVGNDSGRDYRTFLEAVAMLKLDVHLVCSEARLAGLVLPPNVTVHPYVDHAQYRQMLQAAKVVVVPTRELAYPTGQTVALEAMATGACVVATDSTPMREYLTDGVDALMVAAGEPLSLRRAIRLASEDGELRRRLGATANQTVLHRFSQQRMWSAVSDVMSARLGI